VKIELNSPYSAAPGSGTFESISILSVRFQPGPLTHACSLVGILTFVMNETVKVGLALNMELPVLFAVKVFLPDLRSPFVFDRFLLCIEEGTAKRASLCRAKMNSNVCLAVAASRRSKG
jgi:hypothetical protein